MNRKRRLVFLSVLAIWGGMTIACIAGANAQEGLTPRLYMPVIEKSAKTPEFIEPTGGPPPTLPVATPQPPTPTATPRPPTPTPGGYNG